MAAENKYYFLQNVTDGWTYRRSELQGKFASYKLQHYKNIYLIV